MARVGRLAGAILAETRSEFYLIGDTKVPCDWVAAGFDPPVERDARRCPFVRLSATRPIEITIPYLTVDVEDEALPRLLTEVFLIQRTGLVSERLWRLVAGDDGDDAPCAEVVQARWLGEVPRSIWRIVRDTVLRCS